MSHIKQTTEQTFTHDVLESRIPVLVDFYADWCAPCKAQTPILDTLAENLSGELNVVKVNIDQAPELAQTFGVRSIPTLILFRNGEAQATRVGVQTQPQLQALVAAT